MKRITLWIISAPSLLVILVACLGIISTWGAKTFLTKGINVGLEGIVTVIRSGEATLGRFYNIVSETLPTAMIAVESMLTADREPSRSITVIQEKAVFMVKDSEIRQNVQALKNISQELKDRLVKIKADLSTVLEKIEVVRAKITGWITWLLMGIFLVMFWVAGGQIYLLWHFWKTRSSRTD